MKNLKRFLAVLAVMVIAFAVPAFASSPVIQTPATGACHHESCAGEANCNGNNGFCRIVVGDVVAHVVGNGPTTLFVNGVAVRTANSNFNYEVDLPDGYTLNIRVQGNKIRIGGSNGTRIIPPANNGPTLIGSEVVSVETDVTRELGAANFTAHIIQQQGNTNTTVFGAVGTVNVVTTVTTVTRYRWSDGTTTYSESVVTSTETDTVEYTLRYVHQNNFFNNPRNIHVGPFVVRFQSIGNTDVRVFQFVSVVPEFDSGEYTIIVSDDFVGDICQVSRPPVTWEHHNGRRGDSVWNR